jgi:glycosyltransferase involved in cell wall biosynthesis
VKASFIIPCRNKAQHVAATARSVLVQTHSPMEIVFSDQDSQDDTLAIISSLASGYDGPNKVRVLSCPDTEWRGMPGLNAHLNWLDTQIDGDVVIMCSADDLNHPRRAELTVRAFEEYSPSYVNTGVKYLLPDGTVEGYTNFENKASRMLTMEESIRDQIHSSGSSAWARDLYQEHGPLIGCEQQDMILPTMALMERGIYYIDAPLHTYIKHANPDNTGFGGRIAAAEDDREKAKIIEVNNFINVHNWTRILKRYNERPGWIQGLTANPAAMDALLEKVTSTAYAWAAVREAMILSDIEPLQLRVH